MEWWFYIVLLIQSALQSVFLVCWFRTDHRFRDWLVLVLFFTGMLYPLNQFLFTENVLVRNIFDLLALFLLCTLLFRTENRKTMLSGVILYEMLLVSCEIISISTGFFVFRTPPTAESGSYTIFMYFCGSIILLILIPVVLRLFSRGLTSSDKINSFLYSLMINGILMGFIWGLTVVPGYSKIYPSSYVSISILIALISLYTIVSLIRFSHRESQIQAQLRIETAYMDQIEAYLKAEEQEENIHRLRHDLINFNRSAWCDPALASPDSTGKKGEESE